MKVASALLTVPKAAPGEMLRSRLTAPFEASGRRILFVHAGAGYGKTTLLAQLTRGEAHPIWLSLTGEPDVLAFASLDLLSEIQDMRLYCIGKWVTVCIPDMLHDHAS